MIPERRNLTFLTATVPHVYEIGTQVESIGHNEKPGTLIVSTEATMTVPKSGAASEQHAKMI